MLNENWARPYFQEYHQEPHLFYAVLGDFSVTEELQEFAKTLPAKITCRLIEASYFRDGIIWDQLLQSDPQLADRAAATEQAVVVQGTVDRQTNLDYLRASIDFLNYLTDVGGEVVYDTYALAWFGKEAWNQRHTDGQLFNPFDHMILLNSPEDDGTHWLHTRGMLKFGRPDISVRQVAESSIPSVKKMIDRFITFTALGGVVEEGREVVMEGLEPGYRPGPVVGDKEDPDFNNWHIEIGKS